MKQRIYLACPYSHDNKSVREQRALIASKVSAELMQHGHEVFSPISHGHVICEQNSEIGLDAETWSGLNNFMLTEWATHIYMVQIDGWLESKGCSAELAIAEEIGLIYVPYKMGGVMNHITKICLSCGKEYKTYAMQETLCNECKQKIKYD